MNTDAKTDEENNWGYGKLFLERDSKCGLFYCRKEVTNKIDA